LTVSPWKCARLLKALNLNHRQIVEAALIRAEAIGRTEPHPEIAMKDQAERFPTVVTSHGFNMRQTSFLALHLRSPFPRLRKTNAKNLGGFPISSEEEPQRALIGKIRRLFQFANQDKTRLPRHCICVPQMCRAVVTPQLAGAGPLPSFLLCSVPNIAATRIPQFGGLFFGRAYPKAFVA
jgi:hypothetical protein